jgi:dipeptidyl aminopeptidase/acylaminoacyl peptidase
MKKILQFIYLITALLLFQLVNAQEAITYQVPPKDLTELLLAKPTPSVSIDSKGEWMLLMDRNSYPSVEEMAQPELRIAGLRINPNNFSPSRQNFINNLTLKNIKSGVSYNISGLPKNLLAANVSWSPNEKKIAFTNNTSTLVDLYIIDVLTQKAIKINKTSLNTVIGNAFTWADDQTIYYKTIVSNANMLPKKPLMPKGPTVQENLGKSAPSRTYQDLIKTPYDEDLFEFLATAQLVKNVNGIETKIGKPSITNTFSLSPDNKYFMVRTIKKPFSYLVPAFGFNATVSIHECNGKLVKVLAELPSSELSPSGFDNIMNVPNRFDWRDDEASTITWSMPLDSGKYKNKMEFHDVVYMLQAPFTAAPKELCKTKFRYAGITWGNSEVAFVRENLQSKQMNKVSKLNPTTGVMETLFERSSNDAYSNPGNPVLSKNKFNRSVIQIIDNKILLNNTTGSSPKGDLPFLSSYNLSTNETKQLWRCKEESFEMITDVVDAEKMIVLTRRETQTDVPNYYLKNLMNNTSQQLTNFENPYPQLIGVKKEKVLYKRADGVDLTGNLYLPKGYDATKDGPLPVIIWAYPREFENAKDAAQIRGSNYTFTRINYGSPIFWVTQGYAILDNAEMPIVGVEGKKPNDNFIDQLQMNAEAAINYLSKMGVGDKNRVAVGGHSYGAFMTANLLAHTNLFKAGIARSGAYNRTLTPFGFQNEDRTYWQAPELYFNMSPFSYADKIKTPLLMIHGEMDNNSGTFPIQSERLYNAIKGHGGTVRFVLLPYESHGYTGKENLLHLLWEENNWLEKYVKNAK